MKTFSIIVFIAAIIGLVFWFLVNKEQGLKLTQMEINKITAAVAAHPKLTATGDAKEAQTQLNIAFDKAGQKIEPVAVSKERAKELAEYIVPKTIKKLQTRIMAWYKMYEDKKMPTKIILNSFLVGIDGNRAKAYEVKVIIDLVMMELVKMGKIHDYTLTAHPRGQDNFADVPITLGFQLGKKKA